MKKLLCILIAGLMVLSAAFTAMADETGFVDPGSSEWQAYDELIAAAGATADPDTFNQLIHEADQMLAATNLYIPLYNSCTNYLLKDYVKGVYTDYVGRKYFMYSSLENGAEGLAAYFDSSSYNASALSSPSLDPKYGYYSSNETIQANIYSGLYIP